MKTELAIIGQGIVSPAGLGSDALLHGEPAETMVPFVSRPGQAWPVFKVDLKAAAFARWQKEPRLRRASPISYFLVEAAEQALSNIGESERAQTGLIVAFSTGCLVYSRRLFETVVKQGQKAASPALFPETVFNSPVSHVASTLRLEGAAYSLAGDETAWVAALKTAWLWLERERVKQVLVLGAEEFDSAILDAYRCAGWLKPQESARRFIPAEGAAGLLVRRALPHDAKVITQLEDGLIYTSQKEARAAAVRCLDYFDPAMPAVISTQHNWANHLETTLLANRAIKPLPETKQVYWGEASTASMAWNTVRTATALNLDRPRILFPVFGSNHQVAALAMENRTSIAN